MEKPRVSPTCVSIPHQNRIFVIGGKETFEVFNDKIEWYDSALDLWTEIYLQRPIRSYNLGSMLLPNSCLILLFGGKELESCKFDCETLKVEDTNPLDIDYSYVIDLPVLVKNQVHCSFYITDEVRMLKIYDVESNSWS